MLNTDYLRQRALYNLQDLVTRYLTEEAVASEANGAAMDKVSQCPSCPNLEEPPSKNTTL